MKGMNSVFLMGNIGSLPETNKGVTKVSIAVPRTVKTEEGYIERTDWFTLTAFGAEAEYIANYAKKGAAISIQGNLRLTKWTDKESGKDRSTTDIIVERVAYLGKVENE